MRKVFPNEAPPKTGARPVPYKSLRPDGPFMHPTEPAPDWKHRALPIRMVAYVRAVQHAAGRFCESEILFTGGGREPRNRTIPEAPS